MADDLLTAAEQAELDEDGGISEDVAEAEASEEEIVVNEETPASSEPLEEANDDEPIVGDTSEIEDAEPVVSDRYKEVTMTDTVPPELEEAAAVIAKKFDDSEIDITEYLKQRALIDRQIVNFQIEEANQQKAYNSWMDAQDTFLTENRHYLENAVLFSALDKAVIEVKADVRSRGLSASQIMAAADYLVRDAFNQEQKPAKTVETKKAEAKPAKPTNTLPNLPTLDRIPASSQNDTGTDPFSAIERLQGDAKEAAVAKLSKEQFEQYLAS